MIIKIVTIYNLKDIALSNLLLIMTLRYKKDN